MFEDFKREMLRSTAFLDYCSNKVYDAEQLRDDLNWNIKEFIISKVALNTDVKYDKNGVVLLNIKSKLMNKTHKINTGNKVDIVNDLINVLEFIVKGSIAVERLNNMIFDVQSKGTDTFIRFRLSDNKYCCIAEDWNYDLIIIELSENSVKTLIEINKNDGIESILSKYLEDDWDTSMSKLITKFNSYALCERIGARFETSSIEKELLRNSICESDVLKAIKEMKKNKIKECYQVEYYDIIQELGSYLVKVLCNIDFKEKVITTEVIDNIYDIVDDTFIKFVKGEMLINKIKQRKRLIGKQWTELIKS